MCHRVSPLLFEELTEALDSLRATGHARIPQRDLSRDVPDAYPGHPLPLFVPDEFGELEVAECTWGFNMSGDKRSKLVFNTRIETALDQLRQGRGMWVDPMSYGRCLVPVRAFFEYQRSAPSDESNLASKAKRIQKRFTLPGWSVFLLAGVYQHDRVSIVTTQPNQSVAPVHNRMPLVLAPGESQLWLGPDFATLQDRSALVLEKSNEDF